MRKKIFVICLVVILVLGAVGTVALNNFTTEFILPDSEDLNLPNDDGQLKLSINKENGIVSVFDSEAGQIWTSNPEEPEEDQYTEAATLNNIKSQLVVTYYDQDNKKAVIGNYIASIKRNTFTVTENGNKIRVDYDFSRKSEEFKIPVEYSVNGNIFISKVLVDEIEEYGDAKIGEIDLLPYFMRGTEQDEGYILIPDGSGALIDIANVNTNAAAYSQKVYGRDKALEYYYSNGNSEQIYMPVFGINKNSNGIFAVINGNSAAATINAECIGINSSYSRVYPSFVYRAYDTVTISGSDWRNKEYTTYSENVENNDFTVHYHLLQNGSYSSMAEEYRNELKETYNLSKLSAENRVNGALKAYGVTNQKSAALGIPYTKRIAATTLNDMSLILEDLHSDFDNLNLAVFLKDFDSNGFDNSYPNSLKWQNKVGNNKDYSLLEAQFSNTDTFYQIKNVLYKKSSIAFLEQSQFAQMVSKDYIQETNYSDVTYAAETNGKYALNKNFLKKYITSFINKAQKSKCDIGVALNDIGCELYSDYNSEKFVSRNQMSAINSYFLNKFDEAGITTAVQGGNVYNSGIVNTIYDIPTSSSDYDVETVSIPFYQMVFHGYVNMVSCSLNAQEEIQIALLRCIESGTVPCYSVTKTNNSDLRRTGYKSLYNTCYDEISEVVKTGLSKFYILSSKVYSSEIINHSNENGITITVYDNGVIVVVNYTENAVEYNGKIIESLDFEIIE